MASNLRGLSISNIVDVSTIPPVVTGTRPDVRTLVMIGDSNVISGVERVRSYPPIISAVASDFGTNSPEYFGAVTYLSQVPTAPRLLIGRWINTPTNGFLTGGTLTSAQQAMSNWTTITNGGFSISIDGATVDVTGLDFSGQTNLNGVASVINVELTGDAAITWSGSAFTVTSDSAGSTSAVGYAVSPPSGADISGQLLLTASTALNPVPGFAVETPLDAFRALEEISGEWVQYDWACETFPAISDYIAVGQYAQASVREYFSMPTTTDPRTLESTYTADLASALQGLNLNRLGVQYNGTSPYAGLAALAKFAGVNYFANNSTITLKFKTEIGVTPDTVTESEARVLTAKNCNGFLMYEDGNAILQPGVMSDGSWADNIIGGLWLQIEQKYAIWDILRSVPKLPMDASGLAAIAGQLSRIGNLGVKNGFIAKDLPWFGQSIGGINYGDILSEGYYIYYEPITEYTPAQRTSRIAGTFYFLANLAGAIHHVSIVNQLI